MDGSTLSRAMLAALSLARYETLAPTVDAALLQANCTTTNRAAMFLAQVGHESVGLRYMEEIASGAAYEGRADLGNTHAGDGVRFKGRGPIQITGRYNYAAVSKWAHGLGHVPTATYFVDNPTELAADRYAFLGAVWYWTVARNMNSYADARDIRGATRAVNGALNGITDRTNRWNRCLGLGSKIIPTGTATPPKPPNLIGVPVVAAPKKARRTKPLKLAKSTAYHSVPIDDGGKSYSLATGPGTVFITANITTDADTWARFVTCDYKKGSSTKILTRYPRVKVPKGGAQLTLYDTIGAGSGGWSRRVRVQVLAYSKPITLENMMTRAGKE